MIIKIHPEDKSQVQTVVDCARFHAISAKDHTELAFFNSQGIKIHGTTAGEGGPEHLFVMENGRTVDHMVIKGGRVMR